MNHETQALSQGIYRVLYTLLLMIVLSSCRKEPSVRHLGSIQMYIASEKPKNTPDIDYFAPTFFVKFKGETEWKVYGMVIENFQYQSGYEYLIEVDKFEQDYDVSIPDRYTEFYRLKRIISQVKKESDIPKIITPEGYTPPVESTIQPDSNITGVSIVITPNLDTIFLKGADIVLTKEQYDILKQPLLRGFMNTEYIKFWSNRSVYYHFSPDFRFKQEAILAMEDWQRNTGVRFIEGKGNGNYVEFIHGSGAWSYIGMIGGRQTITIDAQWFDPIGTLRHEIGHTLGLKHEHARPDRDKYIKVNYSNIPPFYKQYYDKENSEALSLIGNFDFQSVMLYSSYAVSPFSYSSSIPNITKLDGTIYYSNRSYLSQGDIETVAAVYGSPYHTIHYDLTNESYSNPQTGDIREYYVVSVRFWEDESCTIPAKLKYPRNFGIHYSHQEADHLGLIHSSSSQRTITVPAGVSSYILGNTYTEQDMDGADIRWYRSEDLTVLNRHF